MRVTEKKLDRLHQLLSTTGDHSLPEITLRFGSKEMLIPSIRYILNCTDSMSDWDSGETLPTDLDDAELFFGRQILLQIEGVPELCLSIYNEQIGLDFNPGDMWDRSASNKLMQLLMVLRDRFVLTTTLDGEGLFYDEIERLEFERIFRRRAHLELVR